MAMAGDEDGSTYEEEHDSDVEALVRIVRWSWTKLMNVVVTMVIRPVE